MFKKFNSITYDQQMVNVCSKIFCEGTNTVSTSKFGKQNECHNYTCSYLLQINCLHELGKLSTLFSLVVRWWFFLNFKSV